jgi:hypothetical protein
MLLIAAGDAGLDARPSRRDTVCRGRYDLRNARCRTELDCFRWLVDLADGAHPIARIVPSGTPAVPWLALTVVRHTGTGTLAAVRYVERYDTLGGLAPDPATCTPQSVGTFRAVHYSAVYEFFQ